MLRETSPLNEENIHWDFHFNILLMHRRIILITKFGYRINRSND